jgi:two-component system response regulator YesN
MKCGYANQYYFSTSFKKKMGITPSAYRESNATV